METEPFARYRTLYHTFKYGKVCELITCNESLAKFQEVAVQTLSLEHTNYMRDLAANLSANGSFDLRQVLESDQVKDIILVSNVLKNVLSQLLSLVLKGIE